MKIMALDIGDSTIGVALSDELRITSQGLMTINRIGIRKDTGKVLELIKEHGCSTVVAGLPLNLDGSDSLQTAKTREFMKLLKNKLTSAGMDKIEVAFHDERYTTIIAERVMIEADLSRKKRKTLIDKQSAVIILQDYLDIARRNK